MAKSIRISDEAYKILTVRKNDRSFSEVIIEIIERKESEERQLGRIAEKW